MVFGRVCTTQKCQVGKEPVQCRKRNGPVSAGAQGDGFFNQNLLELQQPA